MIEINLVPDVKQELIKAERVRSIVISMAILSGIIALVIVGLLAGLVFGVQFGLGKLSDRTIETESAKLAAVEDIENTLTIQNQLSVLPSLHEDKHVNSRIFDVIAAINPAAPNNVSISKLVIDAESKTVTIEAQASGGYPALEAFKKTITATELRYVDSENNPQVHPLATSMSEGERSYGKDAEDKQVLRFTLTFEYPEEIFAPYLKDAVVAGPDSSTNVTDSSLGVPKSLFSPKANDSEEEAS